MEKQEIKHERAKLEDVVPRSAPFVIFLDPCGACNFKCGFCPCNISDFQTAERHKMMDWELFEKISEDLKAFQGQVKVINLFGFGEPLLNPRAADMVRVLKENKLCREVRITTNASLLTEETSCALVDAGIDIVRISVEALSTEGYRDLCGVNIEFSKIVENVKRFYEISRGTGSTITAKIISTTLKTKADEDQFYEIFSAITDHHFVEDIEMYWPEFYEMQMPENQHVNGIKKYYSANEIRQICSRPFTEMCIHSNGIVGACGGDWKFATQYGDVKKEHLSAIWNGERHLEFQRMHLAEKIGKGNLFCAECGFKNYDQISNPELLLNKLKEKFGEC